MKSLIEISLLVVGLMSVSFSQSIVSFRMIRKVVEKDVLVKNDIKYTYFTPVDTPNICSFKKDNLSWYVSAGSFLFKSIAFTGGIRGKNIGLEIGMASPPFSTSKNWNGSYDNDLDYPCPHNDVTYLGALQNPYYGADFLYFINPSDKISFYAGFGVYVSEYRYRARSNVTGWIYDQGFAGSSVGLNPALGVQFFITKTGNSDIFLGVSYNLLRGLCVSIGEQT